MTSGDCFVRGLLYVHIGLLFWMFFLLPFLQFCFLLPPIKFQTENLLIGQVIFGISRKKLVNEQIMYNAFEVDFKLEQLFCNFPFLNDLNNRKYWYKMLPLLILVRNNFRLYYLYVFENVVGLLLRVKGMGQ